jgi:Peptidase family C25
VKHSVARSLYFATFFCLAFGLIGAPLLSPPESARANDSPTGRVVYLAGDLAEEQHLALSSALANSGQPGVLLLDSPKATAYTAAFLKSYRPDQVIPVGEFRNGLAEREKALAFKAGERLSFTDGRPLDLWMTVCPNAGAVVVCPAEPRGQLLQAACLAGTIRAPLFVWHGAANETAQLKKLVDRCQATDVYLIGSANKLAKELASLHHHRLADEVAVAAAHLKALAKQGPIETIVIANPADARDNQVVTSTLAPWVAVRHHAVLLLTDECGSNVEDLVKTAVRQETLHKVESIIFVANLVSIPMVQRPNPIPTDKDSMIDMEPLTPEDAEPYTFAIGRLFHEDPAVVLLMLAREELLNAKTTAPRALIASDPGGSLAMLEIFSRNTAKELRNAGYQTKAVFGKDVNADDLRKQMPDNDIFLWEGHHNTLIRDWEFPNWDEPLPPSLVFLQSCLALKEAKVQPQLSRGSVAVIGSSTRMYSASGGAYTLAFFDALIYEHLSLGGSLRQAKNFLLAYTLLKEKRLGQDVQRSGANLRAAWSFTLWGDPTLKMPRAEAPESALPHVTHEVTGNTIVLALPTETHGKVKSAKYQVEMLPNGRLAGLIRKEKEEDGQPLVPFLFAEVHLTKPKPGQVPTLHSKLPASHYVFCWDGRRQTGYLLVQPRANEEKELRFHVEWAAPEFARERTARAAVGE